MKTKKPTRYLVASDFDKTLSFNDSGHVLGELLGVKDFEEKVNALSSTHLVQSGAELAYLLRHDPDFRSVKREHLIEAGKQVPATSCGPRLKAWCLRKTSSAPKSSHEGAL